MKTLLLKKTPGWIILNLSHRDDGKGSASNNTGFSSNNLDKVCLIQGDFNLTTSQSPNSIG